MEDIYILSRFIHAQEDGGYYVTYSTALSEIKAGEKYSHWIWYIFPNIKGLGKSDCARRFAISCLDEAKAYMAHPVLRERLLEISNAVLMHKGKKPISEIMGAGIDVKKLNSCMTLFSIAAPEEKVFTDVLEAFFDGKKDKRTIGIIRQQENTNQSL